MTQTQGQIEAIKVTKTLLRHGDFNTPGNLSYIRFTQTKGKPVGIAAKYLRQATVNQIIRLIENDLHHKQYTLEELNV